MPDREVEQRVLAAVEAARLAAEMEMRNPKHSVPGFVFRRALEAELVRLNQGFQSTHAGALAYFEGTAFQEVHGGRKDGGWTPSSRTWVGGGMVLAGQPLLRKRFVMDGAAVGTSFASKYLSAALPQKNADPHAWNARVGASGRAQRSVVGLGIARD